VGRLDGYRLHTREEAATKNIVSKAAVVRGVLLQQVFQVAVSLTLFAVIFSSSAPICSLICTTGFQDCFSWF